MHDIEFGKRKEMDFVVNENLKEEIARKQAEIEEAWKSEKSLRDIEFPWYDRQWDRPHDYCKWPGALICLIEVVLNSTLLILTLLKI